MAHSVDTHRKIKEKPYEDGGRGRQVKKCYKPPKAGETWKESFAEISEGDLQ